MKIKSPSKKILSLILVASLFGGIGAYAVSRSSAAASVKVDAATYNILGQHHDPTTSLQKWVDRKPRVASKIAEFDAGIVGMQEVTNINPYTGGSSSQRGDVINLMNKQGYTGFVGSSKNNSPIFWKKSKYKVLSKKEVKIVSVDKKSKGPAARYLTYVRLEKDGKKISVFNYHFNQFREQKEQIEKLKDQYGKLKVSGDSIIFTGDFNNHDYDVRNVTGLWRIDDSSTVDHVLGSYNVARREWKLLSRGEPPASDHGLVGVRTTIP